jgi:hypothetical protein
VAIGFDGMSARRNVLTNRSKHAIVSLRR